MKVLGCYNVTNPSREQKDWWQFLARYHLGDAMLSEVKKYANEVVIFCSAPISRKHPEYSWVQNLVASFKGQSYSENDFRRLKLHFVETQDVIFSALSSGTYNAAQEQQEPQLYGGSIVCEGQIELLPSGKGFFSFRTMDVLLQFTFGDLHGCEVAL